AEVTLYLEPWEGSRPPGQRAPASEARLRANVAVHGVQKPAWYPGMRRQVEPWTQPVTAAAGSHSGAHPFWPISSMNTQARSRSHSRLDAQNVLGGAEPGV